MNPIKFKYINYGTRWNQSLPELLIARPSEFFWRYQNGNFASSHISREADDIFHKSKNILVYNRLGCGAKLSYFVSDDMRALYDISIVEDELRESPLYVKSSLDLSIAVANGHNARMSDEVLRRAFKRYALGDSKAYLSKSRIEDFFYDAANFAPISRIKYKDSVLEFD